jgi:transposase, IS5 family
LILFCRKSLNWCKNLQKVIKKLNKQPQLEMYKTILLNFIHPEHELCQLARKIEWDKLEKDLEPFYSEIGRPAVPIRTIVGLLLLKQIYNMSDETVMERWIENPYWQHFCGEIYFQYRFPFDPSDFVHFRKRIGEDGMKRIFQESIHLFSKDEIKQEVKEVRIDTTVQEKNITFPTDRKLYGKVIKYCLRIAEKEGLQLKRTYPREIKKFLDALRFSHHPRLHKKKIKLEKRFYNITVKIYNDLVDKLEPLTEAHDEILDRMYRILTQQRHDSNKIYSMHEPDVHCISKGKEHKKYEFGNKSSFAYTRQGGIIVGALAFAENPFDGHTLVSQVEQVEELTGFKPRYAIVDRGYKGQNKIGTTNVVMPKNLKRVSRYLKKKREERCRSRSGIEGLISHLKLDHRMLRNYLKGPQGDKTNTFLAAAAHNMKKWMARHRINIFVFLRFLFFRTQVLVPIYVEISGVRKNGYL